MNDPKTKVVCPICETIIDVGNFMAWGAGTCPGCGWYWWWDGGMESPEVDWARTPTSRSKRTKLSAKKEMSAERIWSRRTAKDLLRRYTEPGDKASGFLNGFVLGTLGEELIEPGSALFLTGLRIYEKGEGEPRHIIAHLEGGGWLGFHDAGKITK